MKVIYGLHRVYVYTLVSLSLIQEGYPPSCSPPRDFLHSLLLENGTALIVVLGSSAFRNLYRHSEEEKGGFQGILG